MAPADQLEGVRRLASWELNPSVREIAVFVLARAITYVTLFVGFALVYVPARFLTAFGIVRPSGIGFIQIVGAAVAACGAIIALWCVFTFALVGRGTPAPFDPPRRLVAQGPYLVMRNPMYMGAALVLAGAAIGYESLALLGYVAIFLIAAHLFVVWYEEPTLRKMFGQEYETYCRQVGRWWPGR